MSRLARSAGRRRVPDTAPDLGDGEADLAGRFGAACDLAMRRRAPQGIRYERPRFVSFVRDRAHLLRFVGFVSDRLLLTRFVSFVGDRLLLTRFVSFVGDRLLLTRFVCGADASSARGDDRLLLTRFVSFVHASSARGDDGGRAGAARQTRSRRRECLGSGGAWREAPHEHRAARQRQQRA